MIIKSINMYNNLRSSMLPTYFNNCSIFVLVILTFHQSSQTAIAKQRKELVIIRKKIIETEPTEAQKEPEKLPRFCELIAYHEDGSIEYLMLNVTWSNAVDFFLKNMHKIESLPGCENIVKDATLLCNRLKSAEYDRNETLYKEDWTKFHSLFNKIYKQIENEKKKLNANENIKNINYIDFPELVKIISENSKDDLIKFLADDYEQNENLNNILVFEIKELKLLLHRFHDCYTKYNCLKKLMLKNENKIKIFKEKVRIIEFYISELSINFSKCFLNILIAEKKLENIIKMCQYSANIELPNAVLFKTNKDNDKFYKSISLYVGKIQEISNDDIDLPTRISNNYKVMTILYVFQRLYELNHRIIYFDHINYIDKNESSISEYGSNFIDTINDEVAYNKNVMKRCENIIKTIVENKNACLNKTLKTIESNYDKLTFNKKLTDQINIEDDDFFENFNDKILCGTIWLKAMSTNTEDFTENELDVYNTFIEIFEMEKLESMQNEPINEYKKNFISPLYYKFLDKNLLDRMKNFEKKFYAIKETLEDLVYLLEKIVKIVYLLKFVSNATSAMIFDEFDKKQYEKYSINLKELFVKLKNHNGSFEEKCDIIYTFVYNIFDAVDEARKQNLKRTYHTTSRYNTPDSESEIVYKTCEIVRRTISPKVAKRRFINK